MTPFVDSRHYNCDPGVLKGSFLCNYKNAASAIWKVDVQMQDIKLRQSPISCGKMEFNHFFRILVPTPSLSTV